jgi:hypothetical protein
MESEKADVEALLNEGMPFAEKMLRKYGEFHPFGLAMRRGGEIAHIATWTGEELPPASNVVQGLISAFRSQASEIFATAIFRNVSVRPASGGEPADAIEAGLEHVRGYSVNVFYVYRYSASGELQLEPPFACNRPRQSFAP